MSEKSKFIVSADWLEKHLNDPGVSIIDASWYLPAMGRDARAEYDAGHIPGAHFFDQDVIADTSSGLPHTVPSPVLFEQHVSAMGIARDDTIIVYDGLGYFSAPRVWWLFRTMGAEKVLVLDGGLDGWKKEGRFVTDRPTMCAPTAFVPKFDGSKIASFEKMLKIVQNQMTQIADARGLGRFTGEEPEPREGMRSGHMPGAKCVHYATLAPGGYLLELHELRNIITDAGIDPERPVVTTCGSGVTAAVITLALASLGNEKTSLYDGSWVEWGSRQDTPVAQGHSRP
ncbi:MAG: 3-mercaptopyruvate sulfurtransferase [Pseudomonadota bacterium]